MYMCVIGVDPGNPRKAPYWEKAFEAFMRYPCFTPSVDRNPK